MLPDFVIIGAQKSGSTALMRHLSLHPQIYLPKAETRYFRDPWFQFEDESKLAEAVETTKPGVRRLGIKCPDYLAEERCAARIRNSLGEVPLVAVLREPVDRAISAYFWGMQWGWVPLESPEVGLTRILDGTYNSDYPRAAEVLEYGLFGKHIRRFQSLFGPDRLLVLTDEELRTDTHGTLRSAFVHLDVAADVPLPTLDRAVNSGVYSFRRLNVLKYRHKHILREFPGYEGRYLQPARGARGVLVNRLVSGLDRLVLARLCGNDKPEISMDVIRALATYYRDDLIELGEVTGLDVTPWLRRYEKVPAS